MSMYQRVEELKLGDDVKDRISGFSGVVVAITDWLNGCRRITIAPKELDSGKLLGSETFDAEQVELIKSNAPVGVEPSGGPSIDPVRNADPA